MGFWQVFQQVLTGILDVITTLGAVATAILAIGALSVRAQRFRRRRSGTKMP